MQIIEGFRFWNIHTYELSQTAKSSSCTLATLHALYLHGDYHSLEMHMLEPSYEKWFATSTEPPSTCVESHKLGIRNAQTHASHLNHAAIYEFEV